MPQNNTQSGNVFIIILIGIFLFGALMYAFSKNSGQRSGNISKQQAKVSAQEILNYARLVEGGVDRVRRNGCSETEISFSNGIVNGYSNPNSPIDNSCNIFEDEGGKIDWVTPPLPLSQSDFIFTGSNTAGTGIGTFCAGESCTDLMMIVQNIPLEVCNFLNNLSGNTEFAAPPKQNDSYDTTKFIGDFAYAGGVEDITGPSTSELEFKTSACSEEAASTNYFFYHVLLAR